MRTFDTVTEALNDLHARGYILNFNIAFDKIICESNKICLNPEDFEITEVYRFEGESNPSDEDIVYAVESKEGNTKGVITSAYGIYADAVSAELLKMLEINKDHY